MKYLYATMAGVILSLLCSNFLIAQDTLRLVGSVYDSATHQPVQYVNIGIAGQGIGTVSNDIGKFVLRIPSEKSGDSLTFSYIGYQSKKIKITSHSDGKPIAVLLKPKVVQLKQIEVLSKKLKVKTKGNESRMSAIVFTISHAFSLGVESGCVIKLPNKPVYIKDFNFHIVTNNTDSVKFRLNVYSYDGKVGENLLHQNIYFTVPGKVLGDFKVDLNKYHIVVRGDVFVAVEVVDVYTRAASPDIKSDEYKYDRLYISGTVFGSKCLRRKTNFDKWVKFEGIPGTFSIGFWLTVTY
ncbi:hypothetical protein MNBD_BACTEROID07-1405 [hydrothermal vent metagenome]|uniref:TonB-dependent receptor n=1 Tax=hydrothermal vent metagenome TaxID=652676 RepID=A0A3B0UT60_9ZZZZ